MVFSDTQVEQFMSDGFLVLREAFPRDVALAGRAFIWDRIGSSWEDCATSGQPMIHLRKGFREPPFDRVMNPRLTAAFDHLMGAGRWIFDGLFGWWPVLLPGFPGPGGWHVDGSSHQHLTSPEKGLVTLFLFSDVGAEDGGTPMVIGSHRDVAHMLVRAGPSGLTPAELQAQLPPVDPLRVTAIAGEAGDVAMLHPLMIHGFGPNRGSRIRFACNPLIRLKEPMKLDRGDGAYSPVEEALRRALFPAGQIAGR